MLGASSAEALTFFGFEADAPKPLPSRAGTQWLPCSWGASGGLPSASSAVARMLSALQSGWCSAGPHWQNRAAAGQSDHVASGTAEDRDSPTGR